MSPIIYHPRQIGDETNRFALIQKGERTLYVICLNPSTANESKADATMKKVLGFASYNGYDGFVMLNLCPIRATKPNDLPLEMDERLHTRNLMQILFSMVSDPHPDILFAFGNNALMRDYLLQSFIDIVGVLKESCNYYQIGGLTIKGFPRHPLYAPYGAFNAFQLDDFVKNTASIEARMKRVFKKIDRNKKREIKGQFYSRNSFFPPEENDYMEIQWGTTPLGGDLSIAYFFDKNDQHCTRENMAYMDIIIYNEDGTYVNMVHGKNPFK